MKFKDYDPKLFKIKRKVCQVSTNELADICHMTRQTICNVESGRSGNQSTIILIGLALDGLAEEQSIQHVFDAIEQG